MVKTEEPHEPMAIDGTTWDPEDDLRRPEGPRDAVVFVCRFPGCGKRFQLKGNLKRHQNIHRGNRPFACEHCGKGFIRKADMEVHRRVHTGEKPHRCRFADCGRCFARRSDLLSHERTHSGSRPYACDFPGCGKCFARRFDLHKHQKVHAEGDEASATTTAAATNSAKLKKRRRLEANTDHGQWTTTTTKVGNNNDVGCRCHEPRRTCATPPTTPAPISPTDHVDGPARDLHFELTCNLDHVHFPPDCFSSFEPIESWDSLLQGPSGGCCPMHQPSETNSAGAGSPALSVDATAAGYQHPHVHPHAHPLSSQSMPIGPQLPAMVTSVGMMLVPPPPSSSSSSSSSAAFAPPSLESLTLVPLLPPSSPPRGPAASSPPPNATAASPTLASHACPVVATAKLDDYAAHTSCGHLAIQHGDHRDFVVKNHLVCVDKVKSLGVGGCASGGCAPPMTIPRGPRVTVPKCTPEDPHRPGCGHLPVRHGDHIDYVVEDNLFCQHAGLLEAAEHIELLDDDFWEFYGAIGSLNTD